MASPGQHFTFHGAYLQKKDARRKEKQVGGFIRRVTIRGQVRYLVLKGKDH